MQKMQGDEFNAIEPVIKQGEICSHEVVKLYFDGTHSDYGCIKCKMNSLILENFNVNSKK